MAERPLRRHHPRWEPYALIGPVRICAGAVSNDRPYRDGVGRARERSKNNRTKSLRHSRDRVESFVFDQR